MIPRLLNAQGILGLAGSLALGVLLLVQLGETRHWKKQSASFEQLYRNEQSAFAATVAHTRAAAERARAADLANAERVAAEQRLINERTADDYEKRLAAARVAAERLRVAAEAAADPRAGGSPRLPGLPAAPAGIAHAPGQDRLHPSDALTATEQAIQLDELINWVRRQAAIDPNQKK
jgi:hypothetical protein